MISTVQKTPGWRPWRRNQPSAPPRQSWLVRWGEGLLNRFDRYLVGRTDQGLPRRLNRRCIFIVPTRFGLFFGLVLMLIIGGGLNFNNNSALLFGFLFVAVAWVSMHQTFNNLNSLTLVAAHADSTFAAEQLPVRLDFVTADRQPRSEISMAIASTRALLAVPASGEARVDCALTAERRGWMALPAIRVSTVWPFGLFYAWAYFRPQQRALVYPRPWTGRPALPEGEAGQAMARRRAGGEEFAGLRAYRAGDPPRRIAWKASARQEQLLVQQQEHPSAPDLLLDLQRTPGEHLEERLSRLCRWILMAEEGQRRYALRLGGTDIGPDSGPQHRERCLRALAVFGHPSAEPG